MFELKNHSIPIVGKIVSMKPNNNFINKKITKLLKLTREFVNNNGNILFTRADKGNVIVALDRDEYRQKND